MGATANQQHCIETLDRPLAIEAGAGSGKTFTLTERIVYALEQGYVSDIDEVLAITFTNKAAAELKARVKGLLRSRSGEHEFLRDMALRVDDAWISTIHGMCSRILKAHAIELGIDPKFELAEDGVLATLMDQAIEEVLKEAGADEEATPRLKELFGHIKPRSTGGYNEVSVDGLLKDLVEKASTRPDGFDAFVLPPAAKPASEIASEAFRLIDQFIPEIEAQTPGTTRNALLESMQSCRDELLRLQESGSVSHEELMVVFSDMAVPGKSFGGADYKDRSVEVANQLKSFALEAHMGQGESLLSTLIFLAKQVSGKLDAKKREKGLVSNNDLLVMGAKAIKEHPAIAELYQSRFKLVMIDEFQDTDQVQLDMIRLLAGEGANRLCTVGDAQQSIYRFRNADVEVYRRHLQSVLDGGRGEVVELSENFRSHQQVLSFVDEVFGQPAAFGDSFMSLSAGRDEAKVAPAHPEGVPRIQLQLSTIQSRYTPPSTRPSEVRHLADKLVEFKEAGYKPGDMVILLRSLSNADKYARALRERGLPCVITGGSVFANSDEFATVMALAKLAANKNDTQALYEVLVSKLFELTANDLLLLGSRLASDGHPSRRDLSAGADALLADGELMGEASGSLQRAVAIVVAYQKAAADGNLSRAMMDLLKACGVLLRRQGDAAEGTASVGNYYKGVRLVEQLETDYAYRASSIAGELASLAGSLKASPGALSATDSNFVRLMTIHSSKGLEFPVVAVGELVEVSSRPQALFMENVDGVLYVGLKHSGKDLGGIAAKALDKKEGPSFGELSDVELNTAIHNAATAGGRLSLMAELKSRADAQEKKRLAYVAFTRAKESLIVTLGGRRSGKNPDAMATGIAHDVHTALCGDGLLPQVDEEGTMIACGAGEVFFTRYDYDANDLPDWFNEDAPATPDKPFVMPIPEEPIEFENKPFRVVRNGVFSYSSISDAYHDMDAALAIADEEDEDAAAWAAINANLGDTDRATNLGTAFHRLAQYAVEHRGPGGLLRMPPAERVEALASGCELSISQRFRLEQALERWFGSDVAARMVGYSDLRAEVPLFVKFDDADAPAYLEGEIDLLALPYDGPAGGPAVIVDYKTGGSPDEAPDDLRHKHELQAMCYSLAMMRQGYTRVEAIFVRVEQEDQQRPGQPQCVEFALDISQADELERIIVDTHRKAKENA